MADNPINAYDPTGQFAFFEYAEAITEKIVTARASIGFGMAVGSVFGCVSSLLCGGNPLVGAGVGALSGGVFMATAAAFPVPMALVGFGLGEAGYYSALNDMQQNGVNACNLWSAVGSVAGMVGSVGSVIGGFPRGPSSQLALAGALGGDFSFGAVVQGSTTNVQVLSGLGAVVIATQGGSGDQESKKKKDPAPILGEPQKGTTLTHNAKVQEMAEELSRSGEYDVIWIDKIIRIATNGEVLGKTEPDVWAINFDKKIAHFVEVPSPSQIRGDGYVWAFEWSIERSVNAFRRAGWTVSYDIVKP